jgi:hypothetical protein
VEQSCDESPDCASLHPGYRATRGFSSPLVTRTSSLRPDIAKRNPGANTRDIAKISGNIAA